MCKECCFFKKSIYIYIYIYVYIFDDNDGDDDGECTEMIDIKQNC